MDVTLSKSSTSVVDNDFDVEPGESFYVHINISNNDTMDLTTSTDIDVKIYVDGTLVYDKDDRHVSSDAAPGNNSRLSISSSDFDEDDIWDENLMKYNCMDDAEVKVEIDGGVTDTSDDNAELTIEPDNEDDVLNITVTPENPSISEEFTVTVRDGDNDEVKSARVKVTELGPDDEWDSGDDTSSDKTNSDGEVDFVLVSEFGSNTEGEYQIDAYKTGYCKATRLLYDVFSYNPLENATNVSGIISSDTTWRLNQSPVQLVGDVAVDEGVTLTIEPGVTINMGNRTLYVDGTLHAEGTEQSPINFTSTLSPQAEAMWLIHFRQTSGNNTIKHAFLDYGYILNLENMGGNMLSNCVMTMTYLRLWNTSITDCTIQDVREIRLYGYSSFENNTIQNISEYVELDGSHMLVQYNLFQKNQKIFFEEYSDLIFRYNTVVENVYGLYFEGKYVDYEISYNNIFANQQANAKTLSNYPDNINLSNNWWGTTNTTIIDQGIYDYYDDFSRGKVYYQPILTEFVSSAPPYTTTTTSTSTTSSTSTSTTSSTTTSTSSTTSTTTTTLMRVEVAINEVMSHPNGTEPQWVELYNKGNVDVNLTGWKLHNSSFGPIAYTIPSGVLTVRGFVVYYSNNTGLTFNHLGDNVRLYNTSLILVDNYSWSVDPGVGISFMRSVDGSNVWTTSNENKSPSPGASNGQTRQIILSASWNLISLPLAIS